VAVPACLPSDPHRQNIEPLKIMTGSVLHTDPLVTVLLLAMLQLVVTTISKNQLRASMACPVPGKGQIESPQTHMCTHVHTPHPHSRTRICTHVYTHSISTR
jgi:hypothetical protein